MKDLKAGENVSKDAAGREEWLKKSREIQREVPRYELVSEIKRLLS